MAKNIKVTYDAVAQEEPMIVEFNRFHVYAEEKCSNPRQAVAVVAKYKREAIDREIREYNIPSDYQMKNLAEFFMNHWDTILDTLIDQLEDTDGVAIR